MRLPAPPSACPKCGTVWGQGLLVCPQCGRLVYSDALNELAAQAKDAEAAHDRPRAIQLWRTAMMLLPEAAGQRKTIEATIDHLEHAQVMGEGDKEVIQKKSKKWAKSLGVLAPAAAFLATKGKFLILGLTKLPTLLSMLVFLGFYWQTFGWALALGFVLSIYIHEMGHVITLRHYGIPASVPLFIPGLGAVIFAKQKFVSPMQDARIGLAGPVAGLFAALAAWALYFITGSNLFLALTVLGAGINLFNLVPVFFLDGARGFRGLNDTQRWLTAGVAVVCWGLFNSQMSLIIAAAMVVRLLFWKIKEPEPAADWFAFGLYAALLVTLAGLCDIHVPVPEQAEKVALLYSASARL